MENRIHVPNPLISIESMGISISDGEIPIAWFISKGKIPTNKWMITRKSIHIPISPMESPCFHHGKSITFIAGRISLGQIAKDKVIQ
jgi:hypothetical protein